MNSVGHVETQFLQHGTPHEPLRLRGGVAFDTVDIAYETYGQLNSDRSNAVLVFHALTGSQHAAGHNPHVSGIDNRWTEENVTGWWEGYIGPGGPIDTDELFVICANYLGGCYGSTGPSSVDPKTGDRYGSTFPFLGFADMVDAQLPLLDHFGIDVLHAVIGGSTGGLMALSFATRYPERVRIVAPVASGMRTTSLQLIHNLEQITAIETDGNFCGGDYYDGPRPDAGLALARMIQHKTFVSLDALKLRASNVVRSDSGPDSYALRHPVESYMWYQGHKFVDRFDANSFMRIVAAWSAFDLAADAGVADIETAMARCKDHRFLVFSIDSDVCFYPDQQTEITSLLDRLGISATSVPIESDKGHDSFLVEPDLYADGFRRILLG